MCSRCVTISSMNKRLPSNVGYLNIWTAAQAHTQTHTYTAMSGDGLQPQLFWFIPLLRLSTNFSYFVYCCVLHCNLSLIVFHFLFLLPCTFWCWHFILSALTFLRACIFSCWHISIFSCCCCCFLNSHYFEFALSGRADRKCVVRLRMQSAFKPFISVHFNFGWASMCTRKLAKKANTSIWNVLKLRPELLLFSCLSDWLESRSLCYFQLTNHVSNDEWRWLSCFCYQRLIIEFHRPMRTLRR